MMETLLQTLVTLLAPEMGRAKDTRVFDVTTSSATVDLSQYRGRVLLIQSDVKVALAWGPSHETAPTASLTADRGGVILPIGLLAMHLVSDRAAVAGVVGDAAGSLWVAPVTRALPHMLARLLERAA